MTEKFMKYLAIAILFFLGLFALFGIPVSAASLFDVTDENSLFYPELDDEGSNLPDYATNENGEILVNSKTTLSQVLSPEASPEPDADTDTDVDTDADTGSVSGSDINSPVTLIDMQALMDDALAESRATSLSIADAYLSSAIVDVFSRVADGLPTHYKYAAYRLNASDNNEGYLIFGPKAKKNGNYLDFESGAQLAHYYRVQRQSNYQTWYEYKYDVSTIYDTYRVPYGSGQLIYTNMVSGYPVLSELTETHMASVIVPVLIVVVALIFIVRRKQ